MDILSISKEVAVATLSKEKEVQIKIASSDTVATEATSTGDMIAVDEVVVDEAATEETVTDSTVIGGDTTTDVIAVDGTNVEPINNEGVYTEDGMYTETGVAAMKDPLLASWPFVIGISAAVLFVSVVLGAFLAKRKIKKGIELYED